MNVAIVSSYECLVAVMEVLSVNGSGEFGYSPLGDGRFVITSDTDDDTNTALATGAAAMWQLLKS